MFTLAYCRKCIYITITKQCNKNDKLNNVSKFLFPFQLSALLICGTAVLPATFRNNERKRAVKAKNYYSWKESIRRIIIAGKITKSIKKRCNSTQFGCFL